MVKDRSLSSIEICAGGGGMALGIEAAGFEAVALVEIDPDARATLRLNRPEWNVVETDVRTFKASEFRGVELLAGGVPCPPFSVAGKQLGASDERDLFPEALRLVRECDPAALFLENVRGFLDAVFDDYRLRLKRQLEALGYRVGWHLLNASDFGVPQLRPRVAVVALKRTIWPFFQWPLGSGRLAPTVGDVLHDLMAQNGWTGADHWRLQADDIAPTLVGGSKRHGGADLGPTRARNAWASLGVNGKSLAEGPPSADHVGMPRLTVRMAARLQGFPDDWHFSGRKTSTYRQVGNAFPPPVSRAVALQIKRAILLEQAQSTAEMAS